jgi:uracil-DNA glycosylase
MSRLPTDLPNPPGVNALQRLWLREIGVEKLWLRAPEPIVHAAHEVASASLRSEPLVADAIVAQAAVEASVAVVVKQSEPMAPKPKSMAPSKGAVAAPIPTSARASIALAAATADLQSLREMVASCVACDLCEGRKHAVFGMGAAEVRWMVVGEAPGEQEDRQGLPFVGRSGKLLDSMLASVGKSRERDVFIANVIKCRPPGNRNPKPEEIAACRPYLMRQIALLKPQKILVVGRFAAQTLLGTDATIGNLRGRTYVLNTDDGRSIPIVVSYHPAYLLRSPQEKARAWQDLRLAAALGQS